MIVTTGKIIKVDAVSFHYNFKRTSEAPGIVYVDSDGKIFKGSIELPANPIDAENFIKAYRRVIEENIEYREQKSE